MNTYTFHEGFRKIVDIKADNINMACLMFRKCPDIKREQRYYIDGSDGWKYTAFFYRLKNWSWMHDLESIL